MAIAHGVTRRPDRIAAAMDPEIDGQMSLLGGWSPYIDIQAILTAGKYLCLLVKISTSPPCSIFCSMHKDRSNVPVPVLFHRRDGFHLGITDEGAFGIVDVAQTAADILGEDIEPPELLDDGVNSRINLLCFRDVHSAAETGIETLAGHRPAKSVALLHVVITNDNGGALPGKQFNGSLAHTGRSSGNKRYFVLQHIFHDNFPSRIAFELFLYLSHKPNSCLFYHITFCYATSLYGVSEVKAVTNRRDHQNNFLSRA